MKRRVVITGMGTINSLGNTVNEFWNKLIKGESGIERITKFDLDDQYPSKIAGEVKNFNPNQYFDRKRLKKLDLYSVFALYTAKQAIEQSGFLSSYDPDRVGVLVATGIGGMYTFEKETEKFILKGPRRVSPFFIPKMISNAGSAEIAIEWNLRSVNFNIASACASANHAIGTAFRTIQYGDADIMVTGGVEASVTPLTVAGFSSMKALSTKNDEPHKACRPFDAERDGFILAEGSGIIILEELTHAKKRGAHIIAEVVGYGATCDAYHITAPAPNGEGGARAIQVALKDANLTPDDVHYINAHGTSTPLNDKNETIAFKTVFGENAYKLKINSTKSMVGHSLGAAAGIEAIVCCKTIETGIIHPTINLEHPDPDCDLDYVPNKAIEQKVDVAVSNALGFGGHNGVIIFKRYTD